ncbi:SGNH/GDSL hydrolase family protein [Clostridium sp. Marseille-P299]|uniref:SGNH/GDSL hydrolase family protein n=1 Tax=Clostridium sp. Marseille-P299 TaxID=1805477 RepID=UPI0008349C3C|nr:SGNH/GDSL hydrolase family protein [Clostridium sp. Marseille-P299]
MKYNWGIILLSFILVILSFSGCSKRKLGETVQDKTNQYDLNIVENDLGKNEKSKDLKSELVKDQEDTIQEEAKQEEIDQIDLEQKDKNQEALPQSVGKKDENKKTEKKEVYNTMLKRSLVSTGNTYRMKTAIEKAKQGEKVTIAYIGGSITEGAGASSASKSYAYQTYEYFKDTYGQGDGSNVSFVNAGMGGTPSTLGILRYDRDVTEYGNIEPDIVFIEFAVNDYQEPTNGEAYESLVRKVLSSKNRPAVVLMFSVFQSKWNMQNLYIPVGEYYELPMISIKDAVVPELEEGRMTDALFFADQYHPTTYGHTIMANCIKNYFNAIDEMEKHSEDITIPLEAKIGKAYEKIQMVDRSYKGDEIEIIPGGFSAFDEKIGRFMGNKPTFPENWMKDKEQEDEKLIMNLNCKNLLIVYKASSDTSYGTAEIYVDSKLVMSIDGYQSGGWNNPITVSLINEKIADNHCVKIKMSKDSLDKSFTILAFGYSK